MHEKAFWSDKERVGRLAVERIDASKTACERMRENETSASRKSGTSESRGVREYSAAQSNARLQAHETRGLSLSRRSSWKCFVRDHVPAKPPERNRTIHGENIHRVISSKGHSAVYTFAIISIDFRFDFTNFTKSFSAGCVRRVENRTIVTLSKIFRRERCALQWVGDLSVGDLKWTLNRKRNTTINDQIEGSFTSLVDPDVILASSIGECTSLLLHNTFERVNYATVIKALRLGSLVFRAFNLIKHTTWTS